MHAVRRATSWHYPAVIAAAALTGLLAVARVDHAGPLAAPLAPILSLPTIAFVAAFAGLTTAVISIRMWWVSTALFFAWVPFEDLVRKFAHNDLRVYAVKDLLLILAVVMAAPKLVGCWHKPLGRAWKPTLSMLTVAAVMSIPTAVRDVRIPLNAVHLRYWYLLLFPLGAYIARERSRLRLVLAGLCGQAMVVCGLGITQSIVGVNFLNPSQPDALLKNLTITKILGQVVVVRPPGPFVDAGRFGTYTTLSVVLGACLLQLADTRRLRVLAYSTLVVAGWATFVSGGRTAFIFGVVIAGFALLNAGDPAARVRRRSLLVVLAIVGVAAAVASSASGLGNSQAAYYSETLSVNGKNSELGPRFGYYTHEFVKAAGAGGVLGRGTGDQAIGLQYFRKPNSAGENGFGSIDVEWGPIGLMLWLFWTAAWLRRGWLATKFRDSPSGPVASTVLLYCVLTLTVGLALGMQSFENYITNMFLWFLSGIAFAAVPFEWDQGLDVATPVADHA